MMEKFANDVILSFFVAFGVVIGGSLIGSLATLVTRQPPLEMMADLAQRLKIWAAVAALGGSVYTIRTIDTGLFGGELSTLLRQGTYILSAFAGAQLAMYLLLLVSGEH